MTDTPCRRRRRPSARRRPSPIETLERRRLLDGADGLTMLRPEVGPEATLNEGGGNGAPGFQIDVVYLTSVTASQQAAFTAAVAKWTSILKGEIPDASVSGVGTVDDLRIEARIQAIDGPGNVLGSAGPNSVRASPSFIPANGIMTFDVADVAALEAEGSFDEVIVHEMGHVLGIGTIWTNKGLRTGTVSVDPRFIGTNAMAEYRANSRVAAGTSVPVENTGGSGTAGGHWRETTFNNELMTGYLNSGANPISRMTAASMVDLGYLAVDLDAADLFVPPSGNALPNIGVLSAAPASAAQGSPITVSVTGASDSDGVTNVTFYRESNALAGLQTTLTTQFANDTVIAVDTTASPYSAVLDTTGLAPGTYTVYARATDSFGAVSQLRAATITVTAATSATPGTPDLLPGSDSGSDADNLTNRNNAAGRTLQFSVPGTVAGALVELVYNGTVIGSATATGTTTTVETNGTVTLPEGAVSIAARQTETGRPVSTPSSTLSITVDTVAPTLFATPTYDREVTQDVAITFSENVGNSLAAGDFTLVNQSPGGSPATVASVQVNVGGAVAFVAFDGLLPNGRFRLTLPAADVTDAAGNALASTLTFDFNQFAGDADGDGTVSFPDLLALASNYNTAGKTFGQGNFDYDAAGNVNFSDLLILAGNYNQTLPIAAAAARPVAATARVGRVAKDVLA